jgi:hypothetical protein
VRPEELRIVGPDEAALYRANVAVVELLPWEHRKRLHLVGPAGEQVVVVPLDHPAGLGDQVGISFDLGSALLFDAETGLAAR